MDLSIIIVNYKTKNLTLQTIDSVFRAVKPKGKMEIFLIDNGSNDNCSVATLALDQTTFDCTNLGDNTVTLAVEDACGNTSTCDATVTVVDNLPPVIICLADKHIAGTKDVSIEQRFEKWFSKYGKTQILIKAKERIATIQKEIEKDSEADLTGVANK